MEFRKLCKEEFETIEYVLNPIGAKFTGSSYNKSLKKYYLDISPSTQATPSLRAKLARALGTQNLVINGRVA